MRIAPTRLLGLAALGALLASQGAFAENPGTSDEAAQGKKSALRFQKTQAPAPSSAAPETQPLPWQADRLNESFWTARKQGASITVDVQVVVLESSSASEFTFLEHLRSANYLYNGLDPDDEGGAPRPKKKTADCGISFRFVGARRVKLPGPPPELAGSRDFRSDDQYGSFDALSSAEMSLLDALGPAPLGGVQVVYIKGLGGGHGHTYSRRYLNIPLSAMESAGKLPAGRTKDALMAAYKNTILLSNSASLDTLAHELGHALGQRHDDAPGNLMRDGGGGDGLLTDGQCQAMQSGYRLYVRPR